MSEELDGFTDEQLARELSSRLLTHKLEQAHQPVVRVSLTVQPLLPDGLPMSLMLTPGEVTVFTHTQLVEIGGILTPMEIPVRARLDVS